MKNKQKKDVNAGYGCVVKNKVYATVLQERRGQGVSQVYGGRKIHIKSRIEGEEGEIKRKES
jgi:hypothetical protein